MSEDAPAPRRVLVGLLVEVPIVSNPELCKISGGNVWV